MSALNRKPASPASRKSTPFTAPQSGRKNVMSAPRTRRSVLLFLFLFNLAVALVVAIGGHHLHVHGRTLHGSQQIMTSVGMSVVALGAGAALLRRRPKRA
jgi:hypothetical protein